MNMSVVLYNLCLMFTLSGLSTATLTTGLHINRSACGDKWTGNSNTSDTMATCRGYSYSKSRSYVSCPTSVSDDTDTADRLLPYGNNITMPYYLPYTAVLRSRVRQIVTWYCLRQYQVTDGSFLGVIHTGDG